jgi:DNA polymerase-3 subunit delta
MREFKQLMSIISKGDYAPFYLLSGTEAYFIDQVEALLTECLTDESSKSFDYSLFYGKDVDASQVVETAKRFPMIAPYHLVVVREAQYMDHSLDLIADYLSNFQPKTILVLCYKHKAFDKRKKLYKAANKFGEVLESKELYDNQIGPWIKEKIELTTLKVDSHGLELLGDALGSDLNKIQIEIEKLKIILPEGTLITPELIENHVGFSKNYNNFELYKALGIRDFSKCAMIIKYMAENPKSHPLVLTIGGMYTFFRRLLMFHGLSDKMSAASVLGVNTFFVKDYEQASRFFNMKQSSRSLTFILEADLKSKGVGVKTINHKGILQDMIIKIFAA